MVARRLYQCGLLEEPDGLVSAKIDSKNGLLASPDSKNSITEVFRKENVPKTFSKENKISKSKEEELELEKLF